MNVKTIAAGCLCALMLCACSPDADSMESRMADTRVLLDKYKENINQDGLKETLAGVEKNDAEAEWKLSGLMWKMFTRSADDTAKMIELENFWLRKAAEDGCPYAMLDLAERINGVIELQAEQREELARKGVELIEAKAEKTALDIGYLRNCYENGIGVEKNLDTAHQWALRICPY